MISVDIKESIMGVREMTCMLRALTPFPEFNS